MSAEFVPMTTFFQERMERGNVRVEPIEVSESEAKWSQLRASVKGGLESLAAVNAGRYVRLVVGGEIMMSDTQMEQRTNRYFVRNAHGDVLIAGLGIGMILVPLAKSGKVKSIVVVEKSEDVIALVEPRMPDEVRAITKVVHADVMTWTPPRGALFDWIYFDIWPTVSGDNLRDMKALHRRFARRVKADGRGRGRIQSWCRKLCES